MNESIAGVINSRGKTLEKGILSLLHDPDLKKKFYDHPLIQGVQQDANGRLPSYIASNKFALALMDILTGPNASANNADALCEGVDEAAKTALTAVLQNPQFKTDQERLEAWYEQSMNRVTGWYKRTSQIRIYVLAAAVTLFMNADSLKILKTLWNNPTMSAVLVEDAKARLQKPSAVPENDAITTQEKQLLGQVTGWQGDWYTDWPHPKGAGFWSWIAYLLKERFGGWLITILAVSLGAPFWFDTLSRFMNVRSAGNPPDTATPPDKSSENASA